MRTYVLDESPSDPRHYIAKGKMELIFLVCTKILFRNEKKTRKSTEAFELRNS